MKRKTGIYLAKLLRHDPQDLKISKDGYILVSDILQKLEITKEQLDHIVDTNDKKRFSYSDDGLSIRADQGHSESLKVDIPMDISPKVDFLYHGTSTKIVDIIMKEGLKPQSRQHVHLSKDIETAKKVGLRKDKDITILKIDSARMREDGIKIYISKNGVYLTDYVDSKYISIDLLIPSPNYISLCK